MLNKLQNEWRSSIIFILFILMITGLFASRALLSVCMITFVAFSFFHSNINGQLRKFIHTPLLWGMSLLVVLPLLSGFWSEDKAQWMDIVRIKFPLLLLPLAFAAPFSFSKKQWEGLGLFFIGWVTIASAWCMFHYIADIKTVNATYLQAKTMITPLDNDHVRFSWLVAVAILIGGIIFLEGNKKRKLLNAGLMISIAWLIIFLHLLAVRTGLFSFYIMIIGLMIGFIFSKKKSTSSLTLLVVLVTLPVTAYFVLPSFHNRVHYIRYEYDYFKKADYLPGSTDAIRIISIKSGWQVMQQRPLGAGFGDIMKTTKEQYAKNYPQMKEEEKILPSSEWVIYGAGTGWPGFIVFTIIMSLPFFVPTNKKITWRLLNSMAAFSFLFDIGLEVQLGVFIYAFIILSCWKWLNAEKM
ncbi:MAG TPA: O-antigen ligase family protein [Chitinophagaceae bacterium]